MQKAKQKKKIAILGGGPSGLFCYSKLIESKSKDFEIHIFERKGQLGAGMPYSQEGANDEHVTNVSDNEIPHIVTSIKEWIKTVPKETLTRFGIDLKSFNEYKVIPRLLFGEYLSGQFQLLQDRAKKTGIVTKLHLNCHVNDLRLSEAQKDVWVETANNDSEKFDFVIICTGHHWPVKHEGKIPGYFDSPYPPSKLAHAFNHPVAIKGSSLTAIDAIRTLARNNGAFKTNEKGKLSFQSSESSPDFKLIMHSIKGMLPAVRFHLEDSHLSTDSLLSPEAIANNVAENNGFLSLDFLFEKDFKEKLEEAHPQFYKRIKDKGLEEFVEMMMERRENREPFALFKAEFEEAEKSIKNKESIHWKEMLAVLSFAMNQPAKYLSAEDMLRLKQVLMPLIAIVIAFVPQSSCLELLALHEAGKLDIISVDPESTIEPGKKGGATYNFQNESGKKQKVHYETFIDCVGQPHLSFEKFPFKGLIKKKIVSPARLQFKSGKEGKRELEKGNTEVEKEKGKYYLKVPGLNINDNFQVVDKKGTSNNRIFIMAVPYIGGLNPDYSGLDFCDSASKLIVESILAVQDLIEDIA